MMGEIELERRCRDFTRLNRCVLLKIQAAKSWPDRMLMVPNGRVAFIEFKATGMKPTSFQLYTHQELRKMRFQVEVVDNYLQFQTILAHLQDLPPLNGSPHLTKYEVSNG